MVTTNTDVVRLIAEFVNPHPLNWVRLARVNRDFYKVFTSDVVWEPYNVYNLEKGIYQHFLKCLTKEDIDMFLFVTTFRGERKSIQQQWVRYDDPEVDDMLDHNQWRDDQMKKENWGDINLYSYLMIPAIPPPILDIADIAPVEKEVPFIVKLVSRAPELYHLLSEPVRANKQVAFAAMVACSKQLYISNAAPTLFEVEDLSRDKDFCINVLRACGEVWLNHVIDAFDGDLLDDPDVRKVMARKGPEWLMTYGDEITQEVIDKFFPTTKDLLPYIRGYGGFLVKCPPVYRTNYELVLAALDGPFSSSHTLCDTFTELQLRDPYIAQGFVRHYPEKIGLLPKDLRANVIVVLGLLQSDHFTDLDHEDSSVELSHEQIYQEVHPKFHQPEIVLKMISFIVFVNPAHGHEALIANIKTSQSLISRLSFLNFHRPLEDQAFVSALPHHREPSWRSSFEGLKAASNDPAELRADLRAEKERLMRLYILPELQQQWVV